MNTTENNKIIAEFMEWDILNDMTYSKVTKGKWVALDKLKFNSNWNWLMEVVEKIRFKTDCTPFNFEDWQSLITAIEICLLNLNIKDTFNACTEFIKWYNKQK